MEIKISQITEKKWFGLYDVTNDLTTEDFIKCLTSKTKLNILLQFADEESLGIYAALKGKGLYGFSLIKNDFFKDFPYIKMKIINDSSSFIIDTKQNINSFINVLLLFFQRNKIELQQDINLYYYETKINQLLK